MNEFGAYLLIGVALALVLGVQAGHFDGSDDAIRPMFPPEMVLAAMVVLVLFWPIIFFLHMLDDG